MTPPIPYARVPEVAASDQRIVVVGAGVVGVSIALELQRRGKDVLVLDRAGVAAGASCGNAGAFAFTDIIPLATPGIMRKAPKWLVDPLGPLSIPPSYALQIAPWMLRFWRASWPDRFANSVSAQSELMDLSRAALERQIEATQGEALIRRDGQMQLYEGARAFAASQKELDLRRLHGIALDTLTTPGEIAEIQPGLDGRFTHAVFTPTWMSTIDPQLWVEHLARGFVARGGRIAKADVQTLGQSNGGTTLTTSEGPISASQTVVAAGAWSRELTGALGEPVPLETERGYNTTLPEGAFDLRTQLTFGRHGFVVTRIGRGVRVGGAVELGGLKLKPNFRRSDILLNKAKQFLPDLRIDNGTQWMGFRPSMPDSLPVIGASPGTKGVFYAFGHGHLGLTQSAGTAELIADLMTSGRAASSLLPFAPDRFD